MREKVKVFIGDFLIVMFVLLAADTVIVMLHKINAVVLKTDYREVFKYEIILCSILLIFALDIRLNLFTRMKNKLFRCVGWFLRTLVCILALVILFFCGKVIRGSMINTAGRADKAVVLGLALENGKPTEDLMSRMNTAMEYLEEYPESQLILTGGNADESGRTEAAVMHEILTGLGISESRLILEDQAKTTKDNFRNVAKMIDPQEPVVLISSNYHMDRAVQTAKKAGFSNILRLPAPSSFISYGANVLSEVVLELNELK